MVSCRFKNWTAVFYDSKTFPAVWSCVEQRGLQRIKTQTRLTYNGELDQTCRRERGMFKFQRDAVSKTKPTLQWKSPSWNRAARLEEEAGSKQKNALCVSTLARLHGDDDYRTILVRHPCMHRENKGGNKSHEVRPRDLFFFSFTVCHMGLRGSTGLFHVGICIFSSSANKAGFVLLFFFMNLVCNCAGSQSFPPSMCRMRKVRPGSQI